MPLMNAANDYNAWRNTLINILSKHGKSPANVTGWTGTTVTPNEATTSQQIDNMKNDIIKSTQALCHVPAITTLDVGNYSVGSPVLLETKTKIEAKLTEMNNVCHHNADYRNYSDDNDDSHNSGDYTYYGPDRTENRSENDVVAYIPE